MFTTDTPDQDLAGRRILVVEDDLVVAQVIMAVLRELGCELAGPIATANAVWESIVDFPPDLVLMDIGIEGAQDGIDTAAMIRRQFDVPVVFLTGATDPDVIDRAKRVGPLGYLVKPINPVTLRTTVQVALSCDSMQRRLRKCERWFDATLKSIGDAVVIADERGVIAHLNSQAEHMLGKSMQAVEGSRLIDLVQLRAEGGNTPVEVLAPASNARALLFPVDGAQPIPVDRTVAAITGERSGRLGWLLTLRRRLASP